jgi:phosphate transport system substrate-binding protein
MKFVKKILYKGLLFGCISFLLCAPTGVSAETMTIAGTGDSQYLLRQLALDFQKKHPAAQVLVPNSVGSGGGIKLLLAGRSELARIARPLKPKEQADGLQERTFAYSPVVFVANLPTPCLQSISAQQFVDMLNGKISNWNQLGNCPDHKIYLANREEGDSAKSVLEQHIPAINAIKQPVGRTIYSTPEAYDTLNQYQYSFGYLPKSQIQKSPLTILDFEGVSASAENVQQGRYPLVVPLGIVWRDQPTGLTKQFLDYLFSPEARRLIEKLNAVPAEAG